MATRKAVAGTRKTLPQTMQAAVIDRFGAPKVIRMREVPVPELGSRDVLIAVHGAGVGLWDAKIRDGSWASKGQTFPLVLGTDGAGVVVATGSQVRRFKPGQRVWSSSERNPRGGFYAEYAVVDVDQVGACPDELTLLEAASAAVTGLTALHGLDDQLKVKRGQTLLIFGGTGAVGHLAIQLAHPRGVHVVATASGAAGTRLVKKLGAHGTFDPRKPDAIDRLREEAPRGIDAILALAGGEVLERCIDLVRPGGRVAWPRGLEQVPRPRPKLTLTEFDGDTGARSWERLARAAAEVHLKPKVAKVFPLKQAAEAQARVEQGHLLGRMVIRVRRG